MARQIPGGTIEPAASAVAAHNETHRSVVVLEAGYPYPHYDGSEWIVSVEQVCSGFYGVPATLSDAILVVNKSKALYNLHLGYGNAGSGKKIFAHKTADLAHPIATVDTMDPTAQILSDLGGMINELRGDYELHRAQGGGNWHVAADTTYILGGQPTVTTFAEAASELNNLKAQLNLHIAFSVGASPHLMAGATFVTAANCSSTDIDSMVALANSIKAKYELHRVDPGIHAIDDTVNTISTTNVAIPAAAFTLANALKAAYELHRADATYHQAADATNTIASANATTIATLITLVAELRTDIDAHFRFGPVTSAERGV